MKRLALGVLVLSFAFGCRHKGQAPDSQVAHESLGTRGDFHGPPPGAGAEAEPAPAPAADRAFESEDSAIARRHRPGLGTEYGETRRSSVTTVSFTRGSSRPDVTLALWYNDPSGVRAMAGRAAASTRSEVRTSDGSFVLSVIDERGHLLSAADIGSKRYAIGNAGQRYRLGIENHSSERFEVVASVDGLDVIDGDDAGFHKRGYILDPFSSLTIDGWRTSHDTVAAFRFGSIEDSYAERRGKGRNVGVIGAAFFHEEGGVAWEDLHRRHRADPFPGRFAPPPPPRRW